MADRTPTEAVEAYTSAWNDNAPERLVGLWHDPVRRHDPPKPSFTSTLAENQARMTTTHQQLGGLKLVNRDVIAQGELACVRYELSGRTGDRDVVMSGIEIFRVVGGEIVEVWNAPSADGPWPV